jgi:hypothetical protein
MCDERERLLDYLYDACDADERRRVEQHLNGCESCRDEISGLRGVRLNLLAWDVPEHGSVWTPFAPARLKPWYREVPAWALAAAASVMFALGLAGGIVSRQIMPLTQQAAAAPPKAVAVAVPATASLTPQITPITTSADLAAMERRILGLVQTQMDARMQPVAAHVQPVATNVNRDELLQEMQRMIADERKGRLQDSDRTYMRRANFEAFRRNELQQLIHWEVTQALAAQQGGSQ